MSPKLARKLFFYNLSVVAIRVILADEYIKLNPGMQTAMRSRGHKLRPPAEGDSLPFSVVGVSCVTHPVNPHWNGILT